MSCDQVVRELGRGQSSLSLTLSNAWACSVVGVWDKEETCMGGWWGTVTTRTTINETGWKLGLGSRQSGRVSQVAVIHSNLPPHPPSPQSKMPLEATMMIIDDSEYMRNGDYLPTRFGAQADAVNTVFRTKIDSNPENTVGIMTMAGKGCASSSWYPCAMTLLMIWIWY